MNTVFCAPFTDVVTPFKFSPFDVDSALVSELMCSDEDDNDSTSDKEEDGFTCSAFTINGVGGQIEGSIGGWGIFDASGFGTAIVPLPAAATAGIEAAEGPPPVAYPFSTAAQAG